MKEILVYTDGSASVAGDMKGYSGFATYFPNLFGQKKAYSLGFTKGKIGEMEVLALLYAIRKMPVNSQEPIKLIVYSDSEYVVKTFTENRLEKWRSNNWTNTSGEVANKQLWILIHEGLQKRRYLQIELKHIKSHQVEKEKDPVKKEQLRNDLHVRGNLVVDHLANYKRHKTRVPDISFLKLF